MHCLLVTPKHYEAYVLQLTDKNLDGKATEAIAAALTDNKHGVFLQLTFLLIFLAAVSSCFGFLLCRLFWGLFSIA